MTYLEFACYNEKYSAEVKKQVFSAINMGVAGISIPYIFLSDITSIIHDGISVSCPIDYPRGMSDIKLRNHATIKAIHSGATSIDLVANTTLYINGKVREFYDDIKSHINICDQNNITLRVMVDYRNLDTGDLLTKVFQGLSYCGVEYGFVSTGYHVDDFMDNLIMSKIVNKHSEINMICNGNIYLPEHYESLSNSDVFGIRFHNINAISRCLSGV